MSEKDVIGLLRLIDCETGKTYMCCTYDSLLLSVKNRRSLKIQLDSMAGYGKLCCGCSNIHCLEVLLNEDLGLQFATGRHSLSCVSYLQRLNDIMKNSSLNCFLGNIRNIPVDFRWIKGCRKQTEFIDTVPSLTQKRLSLGAFIYIINMFYVSDRGFLNLTTLDGFLSTMNFELSRYVFIDVQDQSFKLSPSTYYKKGLEVGTTTFAFAKITGINMDYKSKVYVSCLGIGGRYTVTVPKETWNKVYKKITGLHLFLAGFVTVKEVSSFVKGSYDSYTHSTYGGGQVNHTENVMGSFVLFHTDDRGIICFNEAEKEYLDAAFNAGKKIEPSLVFSCDSSAGTRFIEIPY